jgi:hypothetical protein
MVFAGLYCWFLAAFLKEYQGYHAIQGGVALS